MWALAAELPQAALEARKLVEQRAERRDRIHSGLRHRPVGHTPVNRHSRPHDAALLQTELVLLGLADDRRVELAPDRCRAEMLGPEHVAFLVDQRADDEPTVDRDAAALDGRRRHHRRRQTALHVGGAAPVDPAVPHMAPEWIERPPGARRHHVEMAVEVHVGMRRASRLGPDDVDARVGARVLRPAFRGVILDIEPARREPRADQTGTIEVVLARRVHRRHANERGREIDDLVR